MEVVSIIETTMKECLTTVGKTVDELKKESREYVQAFLQNMEAKVIESTDLSANEIALHFSGKRYIRPDNVLEYDPLFWAIVGKRLTTIEKIINEKAFHNKPHKFGFTPLHFATELGYDTVVKSLLSKTIFVQRKDNWGLTPIMVAVKCGNYEIFKILMDEKVPVMDPDNEGNTMFHYAAKSGDKRYIMELIKEATCNPKLKNKDGETTLQLLRKSFDTETIEAFENYIEGRT